MKDEKPVYNVLMYSHDTYGLGHIRRTMAIANHLRDANTNVLILTGSPIAGRFQFPEQVDFVRIPGMIKKTNEDYQSLSIRIDQEQALAIRTNIILATAQTFRPHFFIVDKEPLGLKREVLRTLEWLRKFSPSTVTILGLRDILDDAEVIQNDWRSKNVYACLEELYDEIWVYGNRNIYDPIEQYNIPEKIQGRIHFTGYIPRKKLKKSTKSSVRKRYGVTEEDDFILVTAGGGGDGYEAIDRYLAMHEHSSAPRSLKTVIVTGPFMPKAEREQLEERANRMGMKITPFHHKLESLIASADLVISMGGYNTVCEILTQQTPSLIIPRETPRKEQLIRAERLQDKGLLEYLPLQDATPDRLRDSIASILDNRGQYRERMEAFALTGLEGILARLRQFKDRAALVKYSN